MKREEILKASREEHKNKDLAELEVICHAGNHASRVGALACCVVMVLAMLLARTVLYGPWVIYCSMVGTHWFIRAIRLKKKSDWVVAGLFALLTLLTLTGFVLRLLEVAA